ncbi:MAG: hypothetical protein HOD63_04380 [Bacteroidetes bacterium]|jgi:hypothetical protein|nr:hypothetical protein [Bacteroidota bacterium]MBT5528948.1 hypothetical protein [Cytophagia bacterium]MBT3423078.1 hypothetical protein [Bacteroidota bacterium]MBT3800555.1 hypothetical protein [Bacteroidota bacterium]MBT4337802.1 hypothetical protein [Bacteroidota bacterium]
MKRKALKLIAVFCVLFVLILVTPASAQPIPPNATAPLGGGLLMLLGAGAVYGISRFIKSRKK